MKGRWIVLFCGLVFSITLALIVGQRLSAQAMTVVVGVIAGVATSIPTSLLVVWWMEHASGAQPLADPAPATARPAEPRIVVVPAPHPQPQAASFGGLAGYGAQSYAGYPPPAGPVYATPALPARRFTVIGGAALDGNVVESELTDGEAGDLPAYAEESVTWQR